MGLSTDLISQFVKITKDEPQAKPDTIAYGTVQLINGKTAVKLDGANTAIPVENSTIDTKKSLTPGNRVMVLIKNHQVTIIGNLTSQSVTVDGVEFDLGKIEALELDNVEIHKKLTTQEAEISELSADYGEFKELTADKIEAAEGEIDKLKAINIDAEQIAAKYATIEGLKATNGDIYNLKAIYASAERMAAAEGTIKDLKAEDVKVDGRLDAAEADIDDLEANVADIDTLIFGSASGNTMHVSFANAVIALLGNAWIKSAMIESVSANKITAGDIDTNAVRVMSEDGKLVLSDETLQISDGSRVRVQIGKDASND
jgi:lipopolysaccharide export system protein LptA